jgi:membrane associated rhomboid family serine protease
MFIPLRDQVPLVNTRAPYVTRALLVVTTLVFVMCWAVPGWVDRAAIEAGVIPAVLFGHAVLPPGYDVLPAWLTPLTSIFLHGGFVHLIGNMLFLQVFGDNVEDALGHWRYGLFYLFCGACGAMAHAAMGPLSQQPLIGASGAVAGIIGAYLVLHPRAQILGLVLNVLPLRIPAVWGLGGWIAFQLYHALARDDAATGWWAHVGGFVAGVALILLLRQRVAPAPDPS